MDKLPTFDEFRSQALARGADEVLERKWQPGQVIDTHSHPFGADALVVQGEMWLGQGGKERRLLPGDTFQLEAGAPHTERYGSEGATYWVGRTSKR